ncbi:MAG TPA: DUF1761 family protein, partial [Terricaulis sp.]|nr:DUF1761 family protein [Terricaulis sp.]
IWAIGLLLYVFLFQQQWTEWMGLTPADMEKDNGRMPLMVVMPVLTAIGISLVIKWRDRPGWFDGMKVGLLLAIFLTIAGRMYGWVYSFERTELFGLDTLHFLLTHMAAGAILGAWK